MADQAMQQGSKGVKLQATLRTLQKLESVDLPRLRRAVGELEAFKISTEKLIRDQGLQRAKEAVVVLGEDISELIKAKANLRKDVERLWEAVKDAEEGSVYREIDDLERRKAFRGLADRINDIEAGLGRDSASFEP